MVNEQPQAEPQQYQQQYQQPYQQNQQYPAQQGQPGYPIPQYSQPAQQQFAPQYSAGYPAQGPRTNVLAIVTLVMAFVMPLAGIICGHISLRQLRTSGESGHKLAKVGLILSYVFFALTLLLMVFVGILFAIAIGLESSSYGY